MRLASNAKSLRTSSKRLSSVSYLTTLRGWASFLDASEVMNSLENKRETLRHGGSRGCLNYDKTGPFGFKLGQVAFPKPLRYKLNPYA
jgi:hypothetical protein